MVPYSTPHTRLMARVMAESRRMKGSRGSRARRELHHEAMYGSKRNFYSVAHKYHLVTDQEYQDIRTAYGRSWDYVGD